jgi:hypothetical protein
MIQGRGHRPLDSYLQLGDIHDLAFRNVDQKGAARLAKKPAKIFQSGI